MAYEVFYDRMHFAKDVEDIITALYRDFLAVRLSGAWDETVLPVLEDWVAGNDIDVDRYRAVRDRVTARAAKRSS